MAEERDGAKLPRISSFGWLVAVLGADLADSLDSRLKEIGLNLGLWPTLFALWEEDGLTQKELAARCSTAHYTTTRVLDSLESLALVKRHPHPSSRRAHLVYLTEKGKALEETATAKAIDCNAEFMSALSSDEQVQIKKLLLKILANRNVGIG